MEIKRKFNLSEVGKQFETVEIGIEGDNIIEIAEKVNNCYKVYAHMVRTGQIR
jgi:hypothetical protein